MVKKRPIKTPYRRQRGAKVEYSPEQTARYKSLATREASAAKILANWEALVHTEPASGGGSEEYHFLSSRAPLGYWTVNAPEEPEPPQTPILPAPPPEPAPAGGALPPGFRQNTVYAAYLAPGQWTPGLPPGFAATSSTFDIDGVDYPWLNAESFTTPINSSVIGANGPRVETLINEAPRSLRDLEQNGVPYWLRNIKIYTLQGGTSLIIVLYRYRGPWPQPTSYTFPLTQAEYLPPDSEVAPLVWNGSSDNFAEALPLTPIPPYGTGGPAPDADPTPPPPAPHPKPPGPPYACDCPDYTRAIADRPASPHPSDWQPRDWSDSKAGAPVGEDGRTYCKHALAVMMKRGEW